MLVISKVSQVPFSRVEFISEKDYTKEFANTLYWRFFDAIDRMVDLVPQKKGDRR